MKNIYLKGRYQNQLCKIEVQCYKKTPSIQVSFRTSNGLLIPITQNLGSEMPPYQCILRQGVLSMDQENNFMDYIEENQLGYIYDYKWFRNTHNKLAIVFQFDAERLKNIDFKGCRRYENHNAKLQKYLSEMKEKNKKVS